jgi:hypothetical protein
MPEPRPRATIARHENVVAVCEGIETGVTSLEVRSQAPALPSLQRLEPHSVAAAERLAATAAVADVDKEASAMLSGLVIPASSHYDRAVRAQAKAARRRARGRG